MFLPILIAPKPYVFSVAGVDKETRLLIASHVYKLNRCE